MLTRIFLFATSRGQAPYDTNMSIMFNFHVTVMFLLKLGINLNNVFKR